MRLRSVHPGHTVSEIAAETGFKFERQEVVGETVPPTEEELSVLRRLVDPNGILRGEDE
jgi:hypothetical protein